MKKNLFKRMIGMLLVIALGVTMPIAMPVSAETGVEDTADPHYRDNYELIWSEDFEDRSFGSITTVDQDGDGHDWHIDRSEEENTEHHYMARDSFCGSYHAASESYCQFSGEILDTKNLLVLPEFDLSEGGEYILSYADRAQDPFYPDRYSVKISTDGGNSYETLVETQCAEGWREHDIDLSEYAGQKVKIVFEHKDRDMFLLLLDCFRLYKYTNNSITGASVSVGQNLNIKFKAGIADDLVLEDGMRIALNVTMNGVTETLDRIAESNGYTFEYNGIAPQNMSDKIDAELVVLNSDGSVAEVLDSRNGYSIKQNLSSLLSKYRNNVALVQFISDLLAYGAAAQRYTGHNLEDLATEGVEGMVEPSERLPKVNDKELTPAIDGRARFKSAGVWFGGVNKLYVKLSTVENVTLKVNGEEVELSGTTYYTDAIYAKNYDKAYTFELYENGELVQTFKYSMNSYIYSKMNDTEEDGVTLTPMAELARALYNYCYSAVEYDNSALDTFEKLQMVVKKGGTVTLVRDLDISRNTIVIPQNTSVTLDLNGKTLTSDNVVIVNYGELTVVNSQNTGGIVSERSNALANLSGTLTVTDIELTSPLSMITNGRAGAKLVIRGLPTFVSSGETKADEIEWSAGIIDLSEWEGESIGILLASDTLLLTDIIVPERYVAVEKEDIIVVEKEKGIIRSFEDLLNAAIEGGSYKLGTSIDFEEKVDIRKDFELDLNGYSLKITDEANAVDMFIAYTDNITFTVTDTSEGKTGVIDASLTVDDLIYLLAYNTRIVIKGGTIIGSTSSGAVVWDGSVSVEGGIVIGGFSAVEPDNVDITGGTFSEDPTPYVDLSLYNVVTVDDGETVMYRVEPKTESES